MSNAYVVCFAWLPRLLNSIDSSCPTAIFSRDSWDAWYPTNTAVMIKAAITAVGGHVPDFVITNDEQELLIPQVIELHKKFIAF